MTRHMLICGEDEPERVIERATLPTEVELHDALTSHSQLIPGPTSAGRTLVVGRESGLVSGDADLVLMDDRGRQRIVEARTREIPTRGAS